MTQHRITIIEDDEILGLSLRQRLRLEGYAVSLCRTGAEAMAELRRRRPDLILCDIRLPDADGAELLLRSLALLGTVPTLFMTAFAQVDQAVLLVRAGAEDYLTKPFDMDELLARIRSILSRGPAAPVAGVGAEAPVMVSPAMRQVRRLLDRLARVDSTVLLLGETGVGKEVAARLLHALGPRADAPFLAVNCASLPGELVDSEIFGHEKGAFTGAAARHAGVAERAGRGTLFLDEVAELPPATQAKLLRLVQERRFTRLGGEKEQTFEARLVCATNADLERMVAEGGFRADLWYRINVISVSIPPLRDRAAEVGPLLDHFTARFGAGLGRPGLHVGPAARARAEAHGWPGNIRELRNRVERAAVLSDGDEIQPADLFPEQILSGDPARVPTLAEVREEAERRHIESVLRQTGGRIQQAAEILEISRTTLWERMQRLGIPGR